MSNASKVRPSRIWYAVAAGLLVVTAIVVVSFVLRAVDAVPVSPIPLRPGTNQVLLEREGLTIYSSGIAGDVDCQVSTAGGEEVRLTVPSGSEQISVGSGGTWYVVLKSVEPVPAGGYTVACEPVPPRVDLAVGPRAPVLAFIAAILGAIIAGSLGVLLATAAVLVVALKRRGYRRGSRSGPTDRPI